MKYVGNGLLLVSALVDNVVHGMIVHSTFEINVFPLWFVVSFAMIEVFVRADIIY